ncbi:MAG: glycosyltransferase [Opitutaceae bacterium]|jgi:glycosyltransferase involved in cell wall biosynthesis|nr:glycosyltransferase [Opitutaceae bacterium]
MTVRPARILILTNGPLARNPRVVKEACALGAAGHAVTVLGVRNHRASVPLDAGIVSQAACFHHEQIELLDGPRAWLRRAWSRLAREAAKRGARPTIHGLGPAICLLRAARKHSWDLIIAHNEISHWAGLRLLHQGRRVAADLEDWHSEDLLAEARRHRPIALLRLQERDLLHRAAHCTTTSHALANALQLRYGGQTPFVITNSFPLGSVRQEPDTDAIPSLLWFSQTIGPGRGLESFCAAWAATRVPSRLTLVGEDSAGYVASLRASLPPSHRGRLETLPPVAPSVLPDLIARHDVGLALENLVPPNKDLTISNKILQYLNAGLAVVATPTAGQREVLACAPDAGVLETFADPAVAASVLDDLLSTPSALRRRGQAARRLAEDVYCWEKEGPRLVEIAERSLRSTIGSTSGGG